MKNLINYEQLKSRIKNITDSLLRLTTCEMILLLGICGLTCCILPIFLGWSYNYDQTSASSSIIVQSIKSREFGYSVMSCIAVLVPLLIELLCDIFPLSWKSIDLNRILRGILILSQLVPSLIVLLVAIPYSSPSILVMSFQGRSIAGFCAAFAKISETGTPVFQAKSIYLLTMSVVITCLCTLYSPFLNNTTTQKIVNILSNVCGIVIIICYSFQTIRWIRRIRSKVYTEITINELECTLYLLLIFAISCGILTLDFCEDSDLGPNTSTNYLTCYNYLVAGFSLSLIVIQGRLVQKEKDMVQKTLETKRLFVRFVSHEIRTPLNTVFLGLKLLREEIFNSDNNAIETLDDIQQSCDIALHILNDLLSFEKIESGLLVLEKEELRPKEWLMEAINPFYVQARKLTIELKIMCISNLEGMILLADRTKISQVIRNVLSNALKFTPPGGSVTITASTVHKKKIPGSKSSSFSPNYLVPHFLRIQIVDTGCGIDKENIHKLFYEIIQFNASKLQNGGGSGLGLWISKAIVTKHEGSITAHSEGLGQGCTFTIDLPLTIQPVVIIQPNNISSRDFTLTRNFSRLSFTRLDSKISPDQQYKTNNNKITNRKLSVHWPLHVLVVDDSPLNRKMLVRLIEKKFLAVSEAVDGVEAVSQIQTSLSVGNTAVDVVLMDYMMPNMDGPTAAKVMRQLGYSGLIIGITGNALQVDIDVYIGNGADKVMTKPVDVDTLITVISGRFNY